MLKRNKHEKQKVIKPIKVIRVLHRVTCQLYADPHAQGFDKKYFDAQTVGDWVLYRGKRLSAHYRGKRFGAWVGPIKFGVRLYHHRIYSVGFKFDKLKIDGEVRDIQQGVTKLKRGKITVVGNKITFSSKREAVDFVSYGSFFNAYVRSSVTRVSGICSHQFIKSGFFGHPQKGHKVIVKRTCHRKFQHTESCKRRGLKGRPLKFCVRDLCAKLPKKIEDKIINQNNNEEHRDAPRKRVNRGQCYLQADPHAHGFNGANFEAQVAGDWVEYRGLHLSVHYRGNSMGRWVGQVQWGAFVYGQRISSRGFDVSLVNIDGRDVRLHAGKNPLPKGGFLNVEGTKITISTNDGEEADFISFGSFFNSFIRSDVESVSGICSQQFVKSSFFSSPVNGHVEHIHEHLCARRNHFEGRCRRIGLAGTKLINCIFDRCAGVSKREEKKIH